MKSMEGWLKCAAQKSASDIFIGAGRHLSFKIDGLIVPQSDDVIDSDEAEALVSGLFELADRSMTKYEETSDDDFPVSIPEVARFRVSAYRQRGTMAAVIRVVLFNIPDYRELGIHEGVMKIASEKQGLILVTGSAGNGKTTTLACVTDVINKNRNCHIITLEDPIEYLHKDDRSLISQREISTDTVSYIAALRACMRQSPDIILLGEMRDHETISTAMTAAETGHLVISTLHTVGAGNTIDRIIDVFPPGQQQQIRVQLSMLLRTVISQVLLPSSNGGLIPAFEIMHTNNAIRNLIRESKTHQIDNVIGTASAEGMISMDAYILDLCLNGKITVETAIEHAVNPEQMARRFP